mgnify:CR=1 FL=1
MAKNVYECLIMLDSSKVSGDVPAAVATIEGSLTKHQAEILASRPWDERRLVYPIKGQKKALYYLVYYKSEPSAVLAIERDFKLNESILRFLTVKINPKLEETMLAVARDPHALALQAVIEDPTDDYSDFGGGGRRGGRDFREPREPQTADAAAAPEE